MVDSVRRHAYAFFLSESGLVRADTTKQAHIYYTPDRIMAVLNVLWKRDSITIGW